MRTFYWMLAMLFLTFPAMAGDGIITGTVKDGKTGETLIGVTIKLKGDARVTQTDIDGVFSIPTTTGNHTIEVVYTDYQSKEVSEIAVLDEKATTLDISIEPLSKIQRNELEGVVVRSTAKKESLATLYTLQKNSAGISDGISAEAIKKSPDRSTGEVLKRVSGTTIQDNKFVIVRGLGDRYNTALVDNAILPSTEPNRKAFSFDIIPASLIDNIIISKAATPDMPGDFAGGLIHILTKEIPENNFNSISIGGKYHTVSTGKNFLSGYRSSTDFLGFDDGARKLPAGLPSSEYLRSTNLSTSQSIGYLQSFNNDFSVNSHKALPGVSLQGSMGRVYRTAKGRFGFTGAINYNHQEIIKENVIRQFDNSNYTDNAYTYSTYLGGVLNAGYSWGRSKIVLKTLYNRIFDDQFLQREGYDYGRSSNIRYYAFDLVQKSLFKASAEGDHEAGKGKLNWLVAYNIVTNNQPDQRKISYSQFNGGPFVADVTTLGRSNNRLFGNLHEASTSAALNYSLPVNLFKQSSIKVGATMMYRQREFNNRYLGAKLNTSVNDEASIRQQPLQNLFSSELIGSGAYSLEDQTVPGDFYNANTNTLSGYAMMDNKISEKLRLVWGARVENYNLSLTAASTTTNRNWLDVLPSANFTYALNDKSNLRASYFRSVARPELREVAGELFYYDYELNANFLGNYNLKRTQIDNLDLRYEIYPTPGEVLSASVFYKNFKNPIENRINAQGSNYDITPSNYAYARNVGIELEIRKSLGFISPNARLANNLNIYANLSLVKSKVPVEGVDQFVNGYTRTERPLSGQSPYVLNAGIGYKALESHLNINVLYNRIGQRIFLVGQGRYSDVYESARNLFDFQASWKFSKRSELSFTIKDILNNPVRFYFDQNNNKKFDGTDVTATTINPDKDWILTQYRPGPTFSLSYGFSF